MKFFGGLSMLKNKKVVIFDMDGTLIDSVGMWNKVDILLVNKIKSVNIENFEDSIQINRDLSLRKFSKSEHPYLDYCEYLKETYQSSLTKEQIYNLRYGIANTYMKEMIDYKKDAEIFIQKLKMKGYKLVIATTTKRANMEIYRSENINIRTKANIDDYFNAVYTREDSKEIKPSPEIYAKILNDLNVCATDCLIFEDSLIGIEAARAASIDCVAVYDKHSDHERNEINALSNYQIECYADILDI